MDNNNNILGIVSIVLSVISGLIGIFNHTKIRSACCGRKIEASFDVGKTTPILQQE